MAAAASAPQMTLEGVQLQVVPPGQPSEEAVAEKLHGDDIAAFRQISVQLETTIFRLLMSAKTSAEFSDLRKNDLFLRYVKLSLASANFVSAVLPSPDDFGEIVHKSFKLMAGQFETTNLLTEEMRAEALFCLATLHRATSLLPSVLRELQNDGWGDRDAELCSTFVGSMFWAQMHLDCLKFAIKTSLTPSSEVLRSILSGFRVSLDTYAAIREAVDLRATTDDGAKWPESTEWDAEDQALADESTSERDSIIVQ